jgi:acetyl-CoA carboxylase biotin carboxyl carrier protein
MSRGKYQDLENLIEIFNRSDWDEMHVKADDLEIFLSNDPGARPPLEAAATPPAAVTGKAPAESVATPAAAPAPVEVPEGMVAVKAPNLGTFYRAPKPGAPPYVEVGQTVDENTEICLIEVMKLFTPVKAGVAGTVRTIAVADAQMVEFDQILCVIEPAG